MLRRCTQRELMTKVSWVCIIYTQRSVNNGLVNELRRSIHTKVDSRSPTLRHLFLIVKKSVATPVFVSGLITTMK